MLSELNFITGKADEKTKYFNVFPCFDRVRQHPNLPGWLHTVLTNLALDELQTAEPVCAGAAGQRSESWLRTGVPFYARPAAE